MKKLLTMALVGILLISSTVIASADPVNLKTLDDAALIDLFHQVQQEMVDRRIEKSATLVAGKYVVGKNIPVGSYLLYCNYKGMLWANISVTDKTGNTKFNDMLFAASNPAAGSTGEESWFVDLAEGDVLECDYEITITVSSGAMFR